MVASVCINGRFLTRRITGVDRYAREIVRELDQLVKPGMVVVAVPGASVVVDPLPLENIEMVRLGSRGGHLWEQIDLARYVKRNNLLPVNLCNTAPLFNPGIVCIHDMNVRANPSFYSWKFRTAYRVMFSLLCKNAKAILTDSNFSKKEIEKHYPSAQGKVLVVYAAWQHIERIAPDYAIFPRLGLEEEGFYFAMSSLAPNKNLRWLVESAKLNPSEVFVIAGGINKKVFGEADLPDADNVVYAGYVSDEEAKALMTECKAFLYPTFYEGFGIPPMEAMACGAQVVVSDIEVMREIYSGAAGYIDPNVPEQLSGHFPFASQEAIDGVLGKYSWHASAKQVLGIIERIISRY